MSLHTLAYLRWDATTYKWDLFSTVPLSAATIYRACHSSFSFSSVCSLSRFITLDENRDRFLTNVTPIKVILFFWGRLNSIATAKESACYDCTFLSLTFLLAVLLNQLLGCRSSRFLVIFFPDPNIWTIAGISHRGGKTDHPILYISQILDYLKILTVRMFLGQEIEGLMQLVTSSTVIAQLSWAHQRVVELLFHFIIIHGLIKKFK